MAQPVMVGQPVIVQAMPQQEMEVTIPQGYTGGMTMATQTPTGQVVNVVIPQGMGPGQAIKVPYTPAGMGGAMGMGGAQMPPPPGCPPGGYWTQENYIGIITILLGIFVAICAFCCPCDTRQIYVVNGVKYKRNGAIAGDCDCDSG